MSDLQEQLASLRQRIARIDRKYADAPRPSAPPRAGKPSKYYIEEWASGQEVETDFGRHFETERLYERHRRHGSFDISFLAELSHDLLGPISAGTVPEAPPERWAFLDTETTGLAGGTGTYAFLIGVGRITPEGFRVRQFFMREYGEEASLLDSLSRHLSEFDILVTYNGKAYDQPLLETRYRMVRARPPFTRLPHLDLLFGARRLWKLRYESCRLTQLENQVLGVERQGDLPGELIPYVYFEYLRTREATRLIPIFHHNATDILTLACLTGIVPQVFRAPAEARLSHGAELVGMARWLRTADRLDDALALFRRSIELGLPDDLLFRTIWDIGCLEKKRGKDEASIAAFSELATCRNGWQVAALEEMAKHYEHGQRNYAMALEMTRAALAVEDTDGLRHRESRLLRRAGAPRARRLIE